MARVALAPLPAASCGEVDDDIIGVERDAMLDSGWSGRGGACGVGRAAMLESGWTELGGAGVEGREVLASDWFGGREVGGVGRGLVLDSGWSGVGGASKRLSGVTDPRLGGGEEGKRTLVFF